jgi:putative proteasome-type protease
VRKVSLHGPKGPGGEAAGVRGNQVCIMTSGLRSLRDKTLAYFDRAIRAPAGQAPVGQAPVGQAPGSMLDVVELYGGALRQVAEADRQALEESKLAFNLHTIVAGQLAEDPKPRIFLVYPEANWIEVGRRSPYLSIGATAYGKPILDRALSHETTLSTALKLAYLSFDSTRTSSADVGFPLDLLTYAVADRAWREVHYDYDDLTAQRLWWNQHITKLATDMPDGPWVDRLVPGGAGAKLSLVQDE